MTIKIESNLKGNKRALRQYIVTQRKPNGDIDPNKVFERDEILDIFKPKLKANKRYIMAVFLNGKWRSGKHFTKAMVDNDQFSESKNIFSENSWYLSSYADSDSISAVHLFEY